MGLLLRGPKTSARARKIAVGGPGMLRIVSVGTRGVRAAVLLGAVMGLVLVGLPAASAQTGNDILVPAGYQVGVFASGFTAATAMDRAPNGDLYVLDSGSNFGFDANGPQPLIKVWKVPAAGGSPTEVFSSDKNKGLTVPALGIAVKDEDNIFVNDGTGLNRVHKDGSVQHLLDLPVQGDHNADHIAIGKDGMLYWGQGSATNSGVVGEDNYNATGWLKTESELSRYSVQGHHPQRTELHHREPDHGRQKHGHGDGRVHAVWHAVHAGAGGQGIAAVHVVRVEANPDGTGLRAGRLGVPQPVRGAVRAG